MLGKCSSNFSFSRVLFKLGVPIIRPSTCRRRSKYIFFRSTSLKTGRILLTIRTSFMYDISSAKTILCVASEEQEGLDTELYLCMFIRTSTIVELYQTTFVIFSVNGYHITCGKFR